MNEKAKQVFKKLCETYVRDINQLKGKKIAKDYFYNDEYEVEFNINGEWVATADILKAFDSMEELIKGKDEYIAKLCNDRAELKNQNKILKEELNAVNGFRTHYKNYLDKIKNLTMANERLNYYCEHAEDQISGFHFRNNSLVERLEKQKAELYDLREFAKLFIAEMVDVDCAKDCNTYDEYVSCYGRELKEAQFDLVKKVVEKYGK